MSWVETESLSFTARHDSDDSAFAERTLDRLENLRLRLEDRFERVPEEEVADRFKSLVADMSTPEGTSADAAPSPTMGS